MTENRQSQLMTFPRRMRLTTTAQFMGVYETKARMSIGQLLIYAKPNGLVHPRLGLAVPRHVGKAVARNTIKRRLREAFRLSQHDWPAGYDLVINVKPHAPLPLQDYLAALAEAMRTLHAKWSRKSQK